MDFNNTIHELIAETMACKTQSWIEADYTTDNGEIDRNKLISALEKWVNARTGSKNYNDYLELIDLIKKDDDAFNCFAYLVAQEWEDSLESNLECDWELNIVDFWYVYGFAIKKVIGEQAKNFSFTDLKNYPFRDDLKVNTQQQEIALTKCIIGYGWDVSKYTNETYPLISTLLPKMKGKKVRVRKKHIARVRRNANKIINKYTLSINGRYGVFRFDGNTKKVPEQFATYSSVVNYEFEDSWCSVKITDNDFTKLSA